MESTQAKLDLAVGCILKMVQAQIQLPADSVRRLNQIVLLTLEAAGVEVGNAQMAFASQKLAVILENPKEQARLAARLLAKVGEDI